MLVVALYEILPLDRGLSVGQGAVGVGVSIGHRQCNNYSNSLKVTHLLSAVLFLTQQCSPSGLKCMGPRYRATPKLDVGIYLMNTSS